MRTVPVLIVGGGPVGLSLALALARFNIKCLLVEQNASITNHPRSRGVTIRTMELFRLWGIADKLLSYERPLEARRFIWAHSLQGEEITRVATDQLQNSLHSPMHASLITQDIIEDTLVRTLQPYSHVNLEYTKKLVAVEQDHQGVLANIIDLQTQQEEIIRADYLVAADGAHSTVRKLLNIEMHGPANLGNFCSIYCEMDLSQWTKHRPCVGFFFTDPGLLGITLFSMDGKKRWVVGIRYDKESKSKDEFNDKFWLHEIRKISGFAELPVNIISKSFWTMGAQNANQYQQGRIFLAGDAAHRLPPTGGLGMNSGIQDAHNLAWKMAYVLLYQINDKLLGSYFTERAPVISQNIAWSRENAKILYEIFTAFYEGKYESAVEKLHDNRTNYLNDTGIDLGFIYQSSAIYNETSSLSAVTRDYHPISLPGARAPHVELEKENKTISTLDLFEKSFVLLIAEDGLNWQLAAEDLIKNLKFPLEYYRIGQDGHLQNSQGNWQQVYEISPTGAVLVRPDGHVGWRSKVMIENPLEKLIKVFQTIGIV